MEGVAQIKLRKQGAQDEFVSVGCATIRSTKSNATARRSDARKILRGTLRKTGDSSAPVRPSDSRSTGNWATVRSEGWVPTLKIRGESEFAVSTSRPANEVLEIVRDVLLSFQTEYAAVLSADVELVDEIDFQIRIVLRATSYAQAEDVMSEVSKRLAAALTDVESGTTVSGLATELIPA